MLSAINGRDGTKNGEKIMKSLFEVVIDAELQKECFWTGKSGIKGVTKTQFRNYTEVIALLYAVIRLADADYTVVKCRKDITYKVLKHKPKQPLQVEKRLVQIFCEFQFD